MLIELDGGLTNRLEVLASVLLSGEYPKNIQLIWEPNEGINCDYNSLFEPLEFTDKNSLKLHEMNVVKYDPGMRFDTRKKVFVNDIECTIPTNESTYVIAHYPIKINSDDINLYKLFQIWKSDIKPIKEIQNLIDTYSENFTCNTYGVQIRRGIGRNYNLNSCILSPTQFSINYILELLRNNNNLKFFMATDSYTDLEEFCWHLGDSLIYIRDYLYYPIDGGYTLAGLKRTVADFHLLSMTTHIYSSYESGFAQRASKLNNIPIDYIYDKSREQYRNKTLHHKQLGLF